MNANDIFRTLAFIVGRMALAFERNQRQPVSVRREWVRKLRECADAIEELCEKEIRK